MLSKLQAGNLAILGRYLMQSTTPECFSMHDFCAQRGVRPLDILSNCGTAACAIGNGPRAGILPSETDTSWWKYSLKFVNDIDDFRSDCKDTPLPYCSWFGSFMFSYRWEDVDNTQKGAARRIACVLAVAVLEYGPVSKFFRALAAPSFYEALPIYSECADVDVLEVFDATQDTIARLP